MTYKPQTPDEIANWKRGLMMLGIVEAQQGSKLPPPQSTQPEHPRLVVSLVLTPIVIFASAAFLALAGTLCN